MSESVKMPTPEEDLPGWIEWMAGFTFRDATFLLPKLHVDLGEHTHFRRAYDDATAKAYFLTRCLLDVQMAASSLIRLRDYVRDDAKRDPRTSDGAQFVMTASLVMEQSAWRRRLAEGLAHLVLFSTTPSDAHYCQCLLVNDAEEAARELKNAQEDFGVASETLKRRATDLQGELSARGITPPVWYVAPGKTFRPPSAATVIRAALSVATPAEQTALGYSYQKGFAGPSGMMHFSTGAKKRREDLEMLRFGVASIMLLGCAVSRRAGKLAGLDKAIQLLREPNGEKAPLPEVGDFVVVTLDRENVFLAEVIAWKKQIGVLGGVAVRYLDGEPYPGVTTDELPSDVVQLFQKRADLLHGVLEQEPRIAEFTNETEREEAARDAVRMVWKTAMRDFWLRWLKMQVSESDREE